MTRFWKKIHQVCTKSTLSGHDAFLEKTFIMYAQNGHLLDMTRFWNNLHQVRSKSTLSGHDAFLEKPSSCMLKMDTYCSREATHRFRTSNNAKSNPEIKGRNSIFFRHDSLQVSGHALFTSTPHVFLLNMFINKTERSIHFY